MKILFLESFYGGSHREFADGFVRHSRHDVTLVTLPARHWKWRQGGSALAFGSLLEERGLSFSDFDGLLVTGLTDLSVLKSIHSLPPVLLYLHETQFHYPLGPGETRDAHYGLTDFTNLLAADGIVFNSHYHGDVFFREAKDFFQKMPDFRPLALLESLRDKWHVVYPGYELPVSPPVRPMNTIPVILWNHRWEHDKNPDDFLKLLNGLRENSFPFKLLLLGERYRRYPQGFAQILYTFSDEIITSAYCRNREQYLGYLYRADFVVSTAIQENFGISVVESTAAGCLPILPNRLSYPELFPPTFLYETREEAVDLITDLWQKKPDSPNMAHLARKHQIERLDRILRKELG